MLEIIVLAISVIVGACIGLFVYLRNSRNIVNRIYAVLTLSLILFPIANHLSLHSDDRLLFIKVVVALTTIAVASLYYLVYFFGDENHKLNRLQKAGVLYTAFVVVLTSTPLVFSGLSDGSNPSPIPNFGAALFFLHMVIFPAASLVLLSKRAHRAKGALRHQYVLMLIGIAPIFLLAPITGFVMPVIMQDVSLIALNPIYAAFFVGMVGYAIVKHKLFDIRFYVVRAAAYIFTLLFLGVIYVAPLLYIVGSVVMGFPFEPHKFAAGVLVGTLAALYFENAKSRFDALTARIFFRDAYDPGAVLGELNRILVSTIDLKVLLHKSAAHVASSIKAEHCLFALSQTQGSTERLIGTAHKSFSAADVKKSAHLIPLVGTEVVLTDSMNDASVRALKDVLGRNNIAAVVPLVNKSDSGTEVVLGYMLLGYKKSGNAYNNQDVRTLSSIADVSVIAIQNAMRFEEIQKFNITLQQRVNEATSQLRRTNAKLKALDETKDDFISMASHQLRTPLTSVKGYLSMVLDGDAGKLTAMQRKMLDQAFVSSQRMVFLIADLLNVSRLKTGKFVIETSRVSLDKTVEDEVKQLKETAKGRSLELLYERPDNFPVLMLDETKIRQVIMNFIDNAIYYTPAGGTIRVELKDTPVSVHFSVTDDGIGVPKREQPHLFTKFYRAGNARQARPDGTGLGLFMAKKVVVAQGGAVIFESREGKGSTFGFIFPKNKLEPKVVENAANDPIATSVA